MINHSLTLTFGHNKYLQILKALKAGRPLRADQLQALYNYCNHLSPQFNEFVKTQWICQKHLSSINSYLAKNSFLSHHKPLDLDNIDELLQTHPQGLQIHYTAAELAELRLQFARTMPLTFADLILAYGNQTLTGAPFVAAGLPHIEFFEWGNAFGIIKYTEISGESDTNFLVHFESKCDRNLEQMKRDFTHKLIENLIVQNQLAAITEQTQQSHSPTPFNITPRPMSGGKWEEKQEG